MNVLDYLAIRSVGCQDDIHHKDNHFFTTALSYVITDYIHIALKSKRFKESICPWIGDDKAMYIAYWKTGYHSTGTFSIDDHVDRYVTSSY